jgi:hypothetical protein
MEINEEDFFIYDFYILNKVLNLFKIVTKTSAIRNEFLFLFLLGRRFGMVLASGSIVNCSATKKKTSSFSAIIKLLRSLRMIFQFFILSVPKTIIYAGSSSFSIDEKSRESFWNFRNEQLRFLETRRLQKQAAS